MGGAQWSFFTVCGILGGEWGGANYNTSQIDVLIRFYRIPSWVKTIFTLRYFNIYVEFDVLLELILKSL